MSQFYYQIEMYAEFLLYLLFILILLQEVMR